jgi:hypothetical protein
VVSRRLQFPLRRARAASSFRARPAVARTPASSSGGTSKPAAIGAAAAVDDGGVRRGPGSARAAEARPAACASKPGSGRRRPRLHLVVGTRTGASGRHHADEPSQAGVTWFPSAPSRGASTDSWSASIRRGKPQGSLVAAGGWPHSGARPWLWLGAGRIAGRPLPWRAGRRGCRRLSHARERQADAGDPRLIRRQRPGIAHARGAGPAGSLASTPVVGMFFPAMRASAPA